jgi:L-lactate dehydrogenase complex protein LldE
MRIGLFIPCYVDAFEPQVGIATLELLERFGLEVEYPFDQTCCGQPMTNTGCHREAAATEALFVKNFASYDYIVCPSGSCAHQVRYNLDAIEQTEQVVAVRRKTFELVEFLHDVLHVEAFPWAAFAHRVSLHHNCNALRGLKVASMSELNVLEFSKPRSLLEKIRGLELVKLARPDECCGFGGTFSVFEEGVSAKMGQDKVRDHVQAGAEYVTSSDSSCMIHQQGCALREQIPLKFIHIAQILNGSAA